MVPVLANKLVVKKVILAQMDNVLINVNLSILLVALDTNVNLVNADQIKTFVNLMQNVKTMNSAFQISVQIIVQELDVLDLDLVRKEFVYHFRKLVHLVEIVKTMNSAFQMYVQIGVHY